MAEVMNGYVRRSCDGVKGEGRGEWRQGVHVDVCVCAWARALHRVSVLSAAPVAV